MYQSKHTEPDYSIFKFQQDKMKLKNKGKNNLFLTISIAKFSPILF